MRANKNKNREAPTMRLQDCDDVEPLSTDGMEVEEFRDADTVGLFMLEWRRRMQREMSDQPTSTRRSLRPGGMMRA
jgi:hypothetical protein